MDKKLYKETIDNIKISQKAVDEAMEKLHSSDTVGKVIKMEKPKHRKLTAVGMIAATLAVVIALSVAFYPESISNAKAPASAKNQSKNSFFVTANAAATEDKITADNFVTIGNINSLIGLQQEYEDESNGDHITSVMSMYGFDIRCRGKNIDTVTYTVKNGIFIVDKSYSKSIKTEGNKKYYFGFKTSEHIFCNSYTVDYDNQPKSKKSKEDYFSIPTIMIASGIDFSNKEIPKSISDYAKKLKGDGTLPYSNDKRMIALRENYENEIFKNTVVTVTATYNNGTTESADMIFNSTCNKKEGISDIFDMQLNAKLVK